MKPKSILFAFAIVILGGWSANAGVLEFVRDQLGVAPTNFPFDSPPSAYTANFTVTSARLGDTEMISNSTSMFTNGMPSSIGLSFTSNRLDGIEITTLPREINDKLLAEFARMAGIDLRTIISANGYTCTNGVYELTYSGLCSAAENMVAHWYLTTAAANERRQQAREALLAGPVFFAIRRVSINSLNGELQEATLDLVREGGLAINLVVSTPGDTVSGVEQHYSTEDGDHYIINFKPHNAIVLPESWRISVSYLNGGQKPQERTFDINFKPARPALNQFEMTEAH